MSALTQARQTKRRSGAHFGDGVAAGVIIHEGALVVLNAAGFAAPATTALNLRARGVAAATVDNSAGADGEQTVISQAGLHRFINVGDIDRSHIGSAAYMVDDQTVAATNGTGTRSSAGLIKDVDTSGVWIEL